jgi:hypothetical protein
LLLSVPLQPCEGFGSWMPCTLLEPAYNPGPDYGTEACSVCKIGARCARKDLKIKKDYVRGMG